MNFLPIDGTHVNDAGTRSRGAKPSDIGAGHHIENPVPRDDVAELSQSAGGPPVEKPRSFASGTIHGQTGGSCARGASGSFDAISSQLQKQGHLVRVNEKGTRIFDIGDGTFRHEFSGGGVAIAGFSVDGRPVQINLYGDVIVWAIDSRRVCPKMERDARSAAKKGVTPLRHGSLEERQGSLAQDRVLSLISRGMSISDDFLSRDGENPSTFTQFQPGPGGSSLTVLSTPAGVAELFSDGVISENVIRNVGRTIRTLHPAVLAATPRIFILDSIGEGRAADGEIHPTVGLSTADGTIVLERKSLQQQPSCDAALRHEIGHMLDSLGGTAFSEKAIDRDGSRIFGEGRFVGFGGASSSLLSAMPDLSRSDFISKYASSGPSEDFAETHEYLTGLRAAYNEAHPGEEYFALSPRQLRRDLALRGLSPGIQKKIAAIVDYYGTQLTAERPPIQERG